MGAFIGLGDRGERPQSKKGESLATIEAGRPQLEQRPAGATASKPAGPKGNKATTMLGQQTPGGAQATGRSVIKDRSGTTKSLLG